MIKSIPGFQDPFSSWSHLLGAGLFLVLSVILMRQTTKGHLFVWIYCGSTLLLLSISGVYHLLGPGSGRNVLLRIDNAAIFLLIVGTMTPMHGILYRSWARWVPLVFLWAAAATFISLVGVFYGTIPRGVWIAAQLGLGWFGAIVGLHIWLLHGWKFVRPVVIGGIYYTVGAVINVVNWPTVIPGVIGPHELFHVAVVVGAIYHWQFVYSIAKRQDVKASSAKVQVRETTAEAGP